MSPMASQITSLTIVYSTVYRRRSKKISKLREAGLSEDNSPLTGEFAGQRASNAKKFPCDDVIMVTSFWRIAIQVILIQLPISDTRFGEYFFRYHCRQGNIMTLTWGFTVEEELIFTQIVRSWLECGSLCMLSPYCTGVQYNITTSTCYVYSTL